MKDYKTITKESADIIKMQEMCEESLSPTVYESWEKVKYWLIKNRHLNGTRIERILERKHLAYMEKIKSLKSKQHE